MSFLHQTSKTPAYKPKVLAPGLPHWVLENHSWLPSTHFSNFSRSFNGPVRYSSLPSPLSHSWWLSTLTLLINYIRLAFTWAGLFSLHELQSPAGKPALLGSYPSLCLGQDQWFPLSSTLGDRLQNNSQALTQPILSCSSTEILPCHLAKSCCS